MRPFVPFAALALVSACSRAPEAEAQAPAPATRPVAAPAGSPPPGPRFAFPLDCQIGVSCEVQHYVDRDPGPGVLDYRCGHRTYEGHKGTDIRLLDMAAQRRGVTVLAAAPGRVTRLRDGVADVSIRAAGAPSVENIECGNGVVIDHGDGWETQYCHMALGSLLVRQGDQVQAGQPLGRVGLSGNTEFPHLHITVRHGTEIVDPFAPGPVTTGACPVQAPMWTPEAARELAYKPGAILNVGLAGEAVSMPALEAGGLAPFTPDAPVLAAYMRAIELEAGDELEIVLTGPGGVQLAANRASPLDGDKAQWFQMVGRRRPPAGWPEGEYRAEMKVWRAGKVAMQRTLTTRL